MTLRPGQGDKQEIRHKYQKERKTEGAEKLTGPLIKEKC